VTLRPSCTLTIRPSCRTNVMTLRPSAYGNLKHCILVFLLWVQSRAFYYVKLIFSTRLIRFKASAVINEWKHFTGEAFGTRFSVGGGRCWSSHQILARSYRWCQLHGKIEKFVNDCFLCYMHLLDMEEKEWIFFSWVNHVQQMKQ
jgi:hypothetical protein